MTYSQQQFLNQFDQPLRNHIIEYCKRLSERNYDVYILMARKAACFMSVLESLGFVSLNGVVVSDRVQEFNSEWLKGKKIAVIDDTIISGTTICGLVEKLGVLGAAEISVHTFCVDSYWFSEDMLDKSGSSFLIQPYMRLDHSSCIRFCRQIVNALSVIPRPYNIDFPTYEIRKLSRLHYQNIFSDENWKVVRTTTLLQSRNDVESISLNFKRDILNQFFESIGFVSCNSMFAKVRVFAKKLFDNKDTKSYRFQCRVVPYIIFNKIEVTVVNSLISAICHSEEIDESLLNKDLVTDSSKMIFLQYYFSERLMKWWVTYTENLLGKELDATINKRSLNLLFSPSLIETVSSFTYKKPITLDAETAKMIQICPSIQYSNDIRSLNPFEIRNSLTQVFLDLYYKKELPARRLALHQGKEFFKDKRQTVYAHRLDKGVSIFDLKKHIASYFNNSTDSNLTLSTFLDNAIDAGIAVPITISENGILYRGFRHGEEVIWGDANDKMIAIFFERLFGKNGRVSKLQCEKLMTLFLKLGLKRGLLTDYNYSLTENKEVSICGVRSYLYGQVTVNYDISPGQKINFNPVIDSDDTGQWTTDRFKDYRLLTEVGDKYYELHFENMHYLQYEKQKDINEAEDLDPHLVVEIKNMADVFKLCYDNKLLNDKKLVWLTSCISILDNTSSLNAEISLFHSGVKSFVNRIRSVVYSKSLTPSLLESLRNSKTQMIWTAVNSGKSKYIGFKEGKGKKVIDEIERILSDINGFASRGWWEYWNQEKELSETIDEDLKELNNKSGLLIIDILNVMTCLHVFLYERMWRDGKIQAWIEELNTELFNIDQNLKLLRLGNGIVSETKIKESQRLRKRKESTKRKIKQWENYVQNSKKLIESGLLTVAVADRSLMKYNRLFPTIKSGQYKNLGDEDLFKLTVLAIDLLDGLKGDSFAVYDEFLLLVPHWGKMVNFSQYVSLIHINRPIGSEIDVPLIDIVNKIILDVELEEYHGRKKNKSLTILHTKGVAADSKEGIIIGGKGERHVERMVKLAGRLLLECKKMGVDITLSFFPLFKENGIRAYYNESNQKTDLLKKEIYSLLPQNNEINRIRVYTDNQQTVEYYSDLLRQASLEERLNVEKAHEVNSNLKFELNITEQSIMKKIFISYSRKDIKFKDELVRHLNLFKSLEIVDNWCCEELREDNWDEEIQRNLDESDVVIYMLSINFFSSSYIIEHEVSNIMKNKGHKKVLCVLVSEFADLNKIIDFKKRQNGMIDEQNESILALSRFQYLPYGDVYNEFRGQWEKEIVPLTNYTNTTGKHIDTAYKEISERVLTLLETL